MKHQRNCEPHTQPDDRAMTRSACSSFVKVLTRSACLSFVKALGFASTDDLLFLVLPTFLRAVVCLKKGLAVLGVFGTSLSTDSVSRTCLGASKYSRDCPLFLIPLLGPGPPATRLTSLSSCLLLPGLPSCSKSFISFPHPPGLIQMVRPLSKIGKLGVEYLERTVRPHACHTPKQKKSSSGHQNLCHTQTHSGTRR
jgi:hypothetical protein